jgi:hypothetical protein
MRMLHGHHELAMPDLVAYSVTCGEQCPGANAFLNLGTVLTFNIHVVTLVNHDI